MKGLCSILLLFALSANAGSRYIRAEATGANTGLSWEDAWTTFASASWSRTNTYFIAGGTYVEDVSVSCSESGTSWLVLKKANAADNSGDAGWSATYATEQAHISGRLSFSNGYIEVDGVTGSGVTGHGIKVYRTDVDAGLNSTIVFSHSTGSPFHLYHMEIGGPGFSFYGTGGDGIYWASTSSASKGVHINYVWLHEIPRNGVTIGELGAGTSYADYGMLVENSVFERTGGCSNWHVNVHGQTFQAGYLAEMRYLIFRNNIFRNCTGQAFVSFLGTSTNNYVRIYNNVFYNEVPDITVYGRATSGSTTVMSQGINSELGETQARDFSTFAGLAGRTLTNLTQNATGTITSYSGSNIVMSGGMSGGITNAAGDLYQFPCEGRSGYGQATSIYTTDGNQVQYFEIVNNTFFNLRKANVDVRNPVDAVGNVAQNNLFMSNYFTTLAYCPTITAHGYWANADGTYDPEDTETTDPFVGSATYDFRLLATAEAVGTGTNRSDIFTTDFAGNTRSVPWDIGAYAYTTNEPLSLSVGTLNVGTITGP